MFYGSSFREALKTTDLFLQEEESESRDLSEITAASMTDYMQETGCAVEGPDSKAGFSACFIKCCLRPRFLDICVLFLKRMANTAPLFNMFLTEAQTAEHGGVIIVNRHLSRQAVLKAR